MMMMRGVCWRLGSEPAGLEIFPTAFFFVGVLFFCGWKVTLKRFMLLFLLPVQFSINQSLFLFHMNEEKAMIYERTIERKAK